MVVMRTMNECLCVNAIIHRKDIPTVIGCLRSGVVMNEFILHNAVSNHEMLYAIIQNSSNVISINHGMIFTLLRQDYKHNRDVIWYLLSKCIVSRNAGLSALVLDAIQFGDLNMVQFITGNWNISLPTPLVVAAKECQYDIMKFLLCKGTFQVNTLDVAMTDAINNNVVFLDRKERLKQIVSLLFKKGATKSDVILKLCAYKSLIQRDFSVLTHVLSFYNLKTIVENIDDYATNMLATDDWFGFVADAFRLQRAAIKIVHCFRIRRRLTLARCIYRKTDVYSPSLVFMIAKQVGL